MRNKAKWFIIGWAIGLIIACGFKGISSKKPDWAIHGKPASVCDYEVAIIYRGQFKAGEEGEKDFYYSVTAQIEWLKKRYEVIKLSYEYGNDVTQNLILRCAVIKYKENKNE